MFSERVRLAFIKKVPIQFVNEHLKKKVFKIVPTNGSFELFGCHEYFEYSLRKNGLCMGQISLY